MIESKLREQISILFTKWSNEKLVTIQLLDPTGSNRRYYLVKGEKKIAIATYNEDLRENNAFFVYSKHFKNKDINVPEIYIINSSKTIYLQQYLGDSTLFNLLEKDEGDTISKSLIDLYKKSLKHLIDIQIKGREGLDFSNAYPVESFDKQSVQWDLNYFKYMFLKLLYIPFDEKYLEEDFNKFAGFLMQADSNYFLFRDFKSQNIMIKDDMPYFIDYQGGRKGALQYDLASVLYESRAKLPKKLRNELLDYYIEHLSHIDKQAAANFRKYYYGFVLLRLLQVMGAYAYRGIYEKKSHFIRSIPYVANNIKAIIPLLDFIDDMPELKKVLQYISDKDFSNYDITNKENVLNVSINSFSFKKAYPLEIYGNGGGPVFDCRLLPNPGRIEKYKAFNGLDKEVIEWFADYNEVDEFFEDTYTIVKKHIKAFKERGFPNLQINYGCTGGQHRSVYCAQKLADKIKADKSLNVLIRHIEQEKS